LDERSLEGSRGRIAPDTSAMHIGLGSGVRRPLERLYRLMARLIGVDLPRDKRLEIALTYIFGVGRTRALETLEATQISGDLRVHQLTDDHLVALRDWIEANYQTEGDLRREVASDIRRKVEIGSYQGRRHRSGLPVRGQRTRTNARGRKGARKPVAGKKKAK
jgi:small subunit ribosomal protein S13